MLPMHTISPPPGFLLDLGKGYKKNNNIFCKKAAKEESCFGANPSSLKGRNLLLESAVNMSCPPFPEGDEDE